MQHIASQTCSALLTAVALLASGSALSAQPTSQKQLDDAIYSSLRDVIDYGAELYNKGNQLESYRVFEGALMTVRPLLKHYPDLQKTIGTELKEAKGLPTVAQRAFALRFLLRKVRLRLRSEHSLWKEVGNNRTWRRIVDRFVDSIADDAKIGLLKKNSEISQLKTRVLAYLTDCTRGPLRSNDKSLKEALAADQLDEMQLNTVALKLQESLQKSKVPAKQIAAVVEAAGLEPVVALKIPPTAISKTLWSIAGGEKVMAKVAADFVAGVTTDPRVKLQVDKDDLKRRVIDYLSEVTKGPKNPMLGSLKNALGKDMAAARLIFAAGHLKRSLRKYAGKHADSVYKKAIAASLDKLQSGPITGNVTVAGKPIEGKVALSLILDDLPLPAVKAELTKGGEFIFHDLPVGEYVVTIETNVKIPAQYTRTATSPLRVQATTKPTTTDFKLGAR